MAEEDFFFNLILSCYEADASRSRGNFFTSACRKIDAIYASSGRKPRSSIIHTEISTWINAMEKAKRPWESG